MIEKWVEVRQECPRECRKEKEILKRLVKTRNKEARFWRSLYQDLTQRLRDEGLGYIVHEVVGGMDETTD